MGQANRRGSYEQRKEQAVARREAEIAEANAKADREYVERMRMKEHMRRARGMDGCVGMRNAFLVASAMSAMSQRVVSASS